VKKNRDRVFFYSKVRAFLELIIYIYAQMKFDVKNIFFSYKNDFKKYSTLSLVFILFSILSGLLSDKLYTSTFSFYSEGDSQLGLLSTSSLASSLLGSSIGSNINSLSLEAVVTSDEILKTMNETRFKHDNGELYLYEIFELEKSKKLNFLKLFLDENEYKDLLTRTVIDEIKDNRINFSTDLKSNVITVNVDFESRILAQEVSSFIIDYVNEYYANVLNSKALDKIKYTELRLQEVYKSIEKLNEEYVSFSEDNKNISSSPRLLLQDVEFRKKISMETEVYIQLYAQFEMHKLNKIDQSKSVYVVDSPAVSVFYTSPNIIFDMLFALFFSLIIIFVFIAYKNK
jgi:hypothetical protein